jgi:hypothetical protein
MARNPDPHPEPDNPTEGVVPHFPPGMPPVKGIDLPRPGVGRDEVPGADYPPERKPFPDHTPDPGISKP